MEPTCFTCLDVSIQNSSETLLSRLKHCAQTKDLQQVKLLHAHALESGHTHLANALISTYTKCGSTHDAFRVFVSMTHRTVVSWTALIHGYVNNGEPVTALTMFHSMDCLPNHVTFTAAIKACYTLLTAGGSYVASRETCFQIGVSIHTRAFTLGYDQNLFVANTLILMYGKLGRMDCSSRVFADLKHRDVVSWNNLILGYVDNQQAVTAVEIFFSMECAPDPVTFVAVLKACSSMATDTYSQTNTWLNKAMSVHKQANELGFDKNVQVANTLVDMYCKFKDLFHARQVFDRMVNRTVISWNALLLGYVDNDRSSEALNLFERMDCPPSLVTFIALLRACGKLACVEKGLHFHKLAREAGVEVNPVITNNLIDMYGKCKKMAYARQVFNAASQRDVVSWNILLLGYVENGEGSVALEMFNGMPFPPDAQTFVAALKACSCIGDELTGRKVHASVCQLGLETDTTLATCLVDLYGKCSRRAAAEAVFGAMHHRNRLSWTALIGAYSLAGNASQVVHLVNSMEESGTQPDSVTVQLILVACSHAGMVDIGHRFFTTMQPRYGVIPSLEHYTCMVDMLGRANRLDDALHLVNTMPFSGDCVMWTSLLESSRKWCNPHTGKLAYDALQSLRVPFFYMVTKQSRQ